MAKKVYLLPIAFTPLFTFMFLTLIGMSASIVFTTVCMNIAIVALMYSLYVMLNILAKD